LVLNYPITKLLNCPIFYADSANHDYRDGLIGGSFALALRKRRFAGRIVGCDRESALKRAKMCGVIDDGFCEPADAVRGSQLVLLATPVLPLWI